MKSRVSLYVRGVKAFSLLPMTVLRILSSILPVALNRLWYLPTGLVCCCCGCCVCEAEAEGAEEGFCQGSEPPEGMRPEVHSGCFGADDAPNRPPQEEPC